MSNEIQFTLKDFCQLFLPAYFRYIRISSRSNIERVRELLVDYWGFLKPRKPYLALSLIGGAKNFRMEGKKKETFKRGLIEASRSTNALILTGGTNTGSMKLMGEAVRAGQFLVSVSHVISLLRK